MALLVQAEELQNCPTPFPSSVRRSPFVRGPRERGRAPADPHDAKPGSWETPTPLGLVRTMTRRHPILVGCGAGAVAWALAASVLFTSGQYDLPVDRTLQSLSWIPDRASRWFAPHVRFTIHSLRIR